MFTTLLFVVIGFFVLMLILWLGLSLVDGHSYLSLIRSGFLLIGLMTIVWGVLRHLNDLVQIGVLLLAIGFATTLIDGNAPFNTTGSGGVNEKTITKGAPGSVRPKTLMNLENRVKRGFSREDIFPAGINLLEFTLFFLLMANAIWFHSKKSWGSRRFLSANMVFVALSTTIAFVLGGM